MKQITNIRKAVCTMANQLGKAGYSLSHAFKMAWQLIKKGTKTRVAGVTFENRQARLAYLAQFKPQSLTVRLERECNNQYDSSAIKVIIAIPEIRKQTVIGYIPAAVSRDLSKVIDAGIKVKAKVLSVIRGYGYKENLGLLLDLAL